VLISTEEDRIVMAVGLTGSTDHIF